MPSGHFWRNYLITKAVEEGQLDKDAVLSWAAGKQKVEKAQKNITRAFTPFSWIGGKGGNVFSIAGQKENIKAGKAQMMDAAGMLSEVAAEKAAEQENLAAEEAERKRIANMYGYSSTIRTTGQGVLGQAPVARKTLLGG